MKILSTITLTFILSLALYAQSVEDKPKAISIPDPIYPVIAKELKIGGVIVVLAKVDKQGRVSIIDSYGPSIPCEMKPDNRFLTIRKAATDAAKTAKFEPLIKNGKAVDAEIFMNYRFDVNGQPTAARDKTTPLDVGDVRAKAISLPIPSYPGMMKLSGTVNVSVLIDVNGKVLAAGVISGNPLFHRSVITSACGAKFSPTIEKGVPVQVIGAITYNFIR